MCIKKELCPAFTECGLNPEKKLCFLNISINVQNGRTKVWIVGSNDGCVRNISKSDISSKINFLKSTLEYPNMQFSLD